MISFEGVTFVRHPGTDREIVALNDISLEIKPGELVAIVGRNGSGKTTMARHMNALCLPTKGRVMVDGLDTSDPRLHWEIRRRVGMVFQNPDHQIVAQVVQEEVAFGPENLGLPAEDIRQRVDEALDRVGLSPRRKSTPQMMSGGQKQRLAIASVLAMRPACMVLDEATTMLDAEARHEVLETVLRLNRDEGMTVVLVTHAMEEAARAQRIVVMDRGTVVRDAAPDRLFQETEDLASLGLQRPPLVEVAHRLRSLGFFEEAVATSDPSSMARMILAGGVGDEGPRRERLNG